MHQFLFDRFLPTVSSGGKIVINSSLVQMSQKRDDCDILSIPANVIAEEIGNARSANMIILGAYAAWTGAIGIESLIASLPHVLPAHRHKFIPLNELALRKGAELAQG
jgi:2-oxoglutarate ferredoxin oxidoreductase subunit gamma